MSNKNLVLTLAGSDPSAGAGLQADLRVMHSLGCYGMGIVTALTAQSTEGVSQVWPLSREQVEAQGDKLLSDITPSAVKVGMLADADVAAGVLALLQRYPLRNIVVDTILLSSSGKALYDSANYAGLLAVMRCATVVTPNLPEAQRLLDTDITDAGLLARNLSELCDGVSVLLTGGHGASGSAVIDTLYDSDSGSVTFITHPRCVTPNTHGTGCVLSSALACYLAQGQPLAIAAQMASVFVSEALRQGASFTLGHGCGPAFFG
ncbi:MAG: bifunctional hydroxymethylpyrimidine kinase/phosphomethylpyrimidine kinase [Bacteroidaceae bacterium]|nr:bifunctional hydroxymethylpyrimidine kinase/phosphomethylpyrimidine kinase [Bacteroidaceae bacterium]